MGCAAALIQTSVTSDTPHAPVSLPLRSRSPASKAPTGFAQNQKRDLTAWPSLPTDVMPPQSPPCSLAPTGPVDSSDYRSAASARRAWESGLPTMGCAAALIQTSVTSETPHSLVSLPLRSRSPASKAPTGFAQNQKRDLAALPPLPKGVGVWLADDGLRSGPDSDLGYI